jgi:hypothetical protein
MRVGGGSNFTVAQGDRSGKPMVLKFDEVLTPEKYDLDYELQKGLVVQWIHDNYDTLKDKYAPTENQTGLKGKFDKNPDAGMMSVGIRVQEGSQTLKSEDGKEYNLPGGSRKSIYAGSEGDVREGALLGQLMSRIQSGDPELVNAFESKLFEKPLGLALKYVGSDPLIPTDIETFAKGGKAGISSQDTVPALLTPGEFIVNKNAAKKIGYNKLHTLNKADKIQGYNKGGYVGIQKFAEGGTPSSVGAPGGLIGFDFNDKMLSQYASKAGRSLQLFGATFDAVTLKVPTLLAKGIEYVSTQFFGMGRSLVNLENGLEDLDDAMPGLAAEIVENGLANKRSQIGQEALINAITKTANQMASDGGDWRAWLKQTKSNLEQNTASITGKPEALSAARTSSSASVTSGISEEENKLIDALKSLRAELQDQTAALASKSTKPSDSEIRASFGTTNSGQIENSLRSVNSGEDLVAKYKEAGASLPSNTIDYIKELTPEQAERLNKEEISTGRGKAGGAGSFKGGLAADALATGRSIPQWKMSDEELDAEIEGYRAKWQNFKDTLSDDIPVNIDDSKLDDLKNKIAETQAALETIRKNKTGDSGSKSATSGGQPSFVRGISQETANRVEEIKSQVNAKYGGDSYHSATPDQKANIDLQARSEYEVQATRAIMQSLNLTKEQRDQINTIQEATKASTLSKFDGIHQKYR